MAHGSRVRSRCAICKLKASTFGLQQQMKWGMHFRSKLSLGILFTFTFSSVDGILRRMCVNCCCGLLHYYFIFSKCARQRRLNILCLTGIEIAVSLPPSFPPSNIMRFYDMVLNICDCYFCLCIIVWSSHSYKF